MIVLGIFMEGPNTGACLVRNGEIVAVAEEERFTRVKRASEAFPSKSIAYCLKAAHASVDDIDLVGVGWDHSQYPDRMNDHMRAIPDREQDEHADLFEGLIHTALSPALADFKIETGLRQLGSREIPPVRYFRHHRCHAASCHYLSGFDRSAALVMDGSGEEVATTTWVGEGDSIELVDHWNLPHSLGWFYAAMTEFLGFGAYSGEGKVMGLAPYGKANQVLAEKLTNICADDPDRIYKVDPTYIYYGNRRYSKRFTDKMIELFGEPRRPESELTDYYVDLAYETQKRLESVAVRLAKDLLTKTKASDLCISGGVAMNCKMNGLLSQLESVDRVFINPASYDVGVAIGAALLGARDLGDTSNNCVLEHAYWGPEFEDYEIETALRHCGLVYEKPDDMSDAAAGLLAEGKIVGWFSGRAEFGARALGARSILANPLLKDVKDIVNARVKYREAFRPFAPSMIEEVAEEYMVDPKPSPFMILAYHFKPAYQELFPGVVHVDGTVRPQTVSKDANPEYWNLINRFGELTGHPVVLNTSFNVRGEPIVNTPLEAIRCYFSTGMDALAIGRFLLKKPVLSD